MAELEDPQSHDALRREAEEQESEKKERETLERHALEDPLTGAYNRRGFDKLVEVMLSRVGKRGERRQEGTIEHVTIGYFDVDNFKDFNELYRHEGGDEAIRAVADYFKRTLRVNDVISRFGGDEFVVAFEGVDEETVLKKVLGAKTGGVVRLQIPVRIEDKSATIEISGGLSEYRHGELLPKTIARANAALHYVKNSGKKNSVVSFNDISEGGRGD